MAHPYRSLFDRVNESRKQRGITTLSWKEFISKEPPKLHLVKRYKQEMRDSVTTDTPVKINRPPAEYDNFGYMEVIKKYES